jgi:hypothetical protein
MYDRTGPRSGFRWWPLLVLFLLLMPFWVGRGHGFSFWPLFFIVPFFFWAMKSRHRNSWGKDWSQYRGQRWDQRWGQRWQESEGEKPKRKNDDLSDDLAQDEKPKRDSGSDIYYV